MKKRKSVKPKVKTKESKKVQAINIQDMVQEAKYPEGSDQTRVMHYVQTSLIHVDSFEGVSRQRIRQITTKFRPEKLPPIVVFFNEKNKEKRYILIDGRVRLKAFEKMEMHVIPTIFVTEKEYQWIKENGMFPFRIEVPKNPKIIADPKNTSPELKQIIEDHRFVKLEEPSN